MERLQQAIEKARAQRDGETKQRPSPAKVPAPASASVQDAWDALPSIQLKSSDMHRNRIVTPETGA
ncbi:MAG: hypothetical protein KDK08_03940, partial [Rhizobiaceae bacterium]|nr:hypothetical protein [Rhizobiaceae bacterium]